MRTTSIVCLLLMAACSGTDGDAPGNVDEYVTAWRKTYCDRLVRCGVFADVATCETQDRTLPVDVDVIAATHEGIVEFNPDVASRCLAALQQRTCDPTTIEDRLWDLPCYGTFTGTRHQGEQCAIGRECISGDCQYTDSNCDFTGECCTGTCNGDVVPPLAMLDESCRAAPCAEGYCEPVQLVCRSLKSIELERCYSDAECAYGAACRGGECVAVIGSGEPCSPNGPRLCKLVGETCNTQSGTCELGEALGGPCTGDTDCRITLGCDDTGHCARVLPTLGESCPFGECESPNLCEGTGAARVCVPPKPDGAMCYADSECDSQRCDPGTGMCSSTACI